MQRFFEFFELILDWDVTVKFHSHVDEVTVGIVFRTVGHSLVWYDEVASVLLAWLTFYGSALASVKRAHISCPEVVEQLPPAGRRAVALLGQVMVIAFFALLGWVGLSIMPILAGDNMVSLPWLPMNVVQSVIPISAALILVAEVMHFIDLVSPQSPGAGASALADGLH